ncbi:hypothetical protein CYY_000419 [Polysphondylium violaceum]|uniref:CBS domain-containing protein n=1 Tax=Polysphondylium violaceum TaxID=133409 RepID=A0A8J4PZR3_9MYCE|nr:hypothetical protein CYY_000419 [Polysphondylium violaceum]
MINNINRLLVSSSRQGGRIIPLINNSGSNNSSIGSFGNSRFYSSSPDKSNSTVHLTKNEFYYHYTPKDQSGYMKKSLYDYDPLAKDHQLIKTAESEYFVFGDKTVGEILKSKENKELLTINDSDTIYQAIEKMENHGVGALLTVDKETGSLVGIITERDYLGKCALRGLSSKEAKVSDIMTRGVKTISPNLCVVEVLAIMTKERFRHIPVTDESGSKVIGLVSITDLIKVLQKNQKDTIKYLREFLNDSTGYSYKP